MCDTLLENRFDQSFCAFVQNTLSGQSTYVNFSIHVTSGILVSRTHSSKNLSFLFLCIVNMEYPVCMNLDGMIWNLNNYMCVDSPSSVDWIRLPETGRGCVKQIHFWSRVHTVYWNAGYWFCIKFVYFCNFSIGIDVSTKNLVNESFIQLRFFIVVFLNDFFSNDTNKQEYSTRKGMLIIVLPDWE